MTIEELRTYFRTAKDFVKIGNAANVPVIVASISSISEHIKEIYKTASAIDKAKCKIQYESFDSIIDMIKNNGLTDVKVLAFFGLAPSSETAPSFSDIMSGKVGIDSSAPPICEGAAGCAPKTPRLKNAPKKTESNPIVESSPHNGTPEKGSGEDKPIYSPDSLRGFIGQQHIVKPLLKEIAIASNKGIRHLDNIMLFGNPGLGKSTLMELIAKELGVRFEKLDCSQFRNSQQSLKALQSFFIRVARENEPVVIALDEIHALTPELQSSLLTLLNDRVYVSPPDISGNVKRIPIEEFTFIGATTDDDKVLDTIKNRCLRLTFQMADYTEDELRRIYKNKIASKGITVDDDVIDTCIPRSRGAIRYVNSIVDGLDSALYNDNGVRNSTHINLAVALKYFDEKGIDAMGLTVKDIEILRILDEYTGDAMGADVLAARAGLDTKKYMSEYEKYLIKIGFINISGKGRALSEKAVKYLHNGCGQNVSPKLIEDNASGDDIQSRASQEPIDDLFGD